MLGATSVRNSDLKEGKPVRLTVDGKEVVLVLISDKVYAMDAVCSHEGGPLEQGSIEEYRLTCPWHPAIFDIRTGKASPETNWAVDIGSYKVILDDKSGQIYVDTDSARPLSDVDDNNIQQLPREQNKKSPPQPRTIHLTLLDKMEHKDTDIMSFRFSRKDDQSYQAGQFYVVNLGTTEDPKGPTRAFTIASSPTEKDIILISTRIRDTPFKQKLSTLENGAAIQVAGPAGDFILPDDNSGSVVFLSGGIGVTPFRSMVKYATDKQLPLKITMFDSNRNKANILYKDEFDSWTKLNKNLRIIHTVTGEEPEGVSSVALATGDWNGERGQINKAMLSKYLTKETLDKSLFYICGPPAMLKGITNLLQNDLKVSKDNIKTEEFTGY